MNIPIGQPLGMQSGTLQASSTRKIVRSSSLKRKAKPVPDTDKVHLEKVLGLTVSNNASLSCEPSGTIAYPAGCVVVLLNARKNKQSHIFNSSKKTITSLAFSGDGKHLVTGESGHQPAVRIWDLEDHSQVAEFHGHKFGINCVAFSPNLKFVVSVGTQHDMIVNVWNWRTQSKVASNKVAAKVTGVAFSEDGSYFVTVGNRHVKFWYLDASRSKVKETVPLMGRSGILGEQKNNYFCGVACGLGRCASSTYVVTQAGLLCEFNDKRLLSKWVELRTTGANCIAVGMEHIFIGCCDGIVRLFDPHTLNFISTMPRPHSLGTDVAAGLHPSHLVAQHNENSKFPDCIAVALDNNHNKLTCVYNDHSLYIWDVRDVKKVGKVYSSLSHSGCIWGLETYPKLKQGNLPNGTFVTSSSDDTIRIWNLDPHMPDISLKRNIYSNDLLKVMYADPEHSTLCDVEFNPAGNTDRTDTTYAGKNGIRCVKFSPDGKQLASGDRSGNIRVHSLPSLNEVCLLEAHDAEVLALAYSPPSTGCRFLASASRDRLIHIFDADQDFSLVQTLDDHSSAITAIHFAGYDDQLHMLSCGADKSLLFRTASEGPDTQFYLNRHLVGKTTLYDMDIDPTKKFVATACQDRNVRIYNMRNGKQRKCYKGSVGDDGTLIRVQLDPSGLFAATSCSDKNLCLLDFFTGEILGTVYGHSEISTGVRFLEDLRHVISVSGDGCIFVWRLAPELTHQMQMRLAELGQNMQNSTLANQNRRQTFNTIPTISLLDKKEDSVDALNNNPEDAFDFPVITPGEGETFKPPREAFKDTEQTTDTMDLPKLDYRFSVGQLPSWAKKQVLQEPTSTSKIGSTVSNSVAPRGRWAQRMDNQGLVVKSMLDENSAIQMSLADCMDKRRFTVEPDSVAYDQLGEFRRETMVISKGNKDPQNIPIITDDDENNCDDEDDDEFHPASRELMDRLEHPTVVGKKIGGMITMSRGSDPFGSSDDQGSDLKISDEFTDEDNDDDYEMNEKNIFYLPHDEESESRDMNLNSFQVFASSDRRKSSGSDSLNKDAESEGTEPASLDDVNSDEEFGTDDSPSHPVTPSTPIDPERSFASRLPDRDNFLKEAFENQLPFSTPQHPTGARLSISSRFLSHSQSRNRNVGIYNSTMQNRNLTSGISTDGLADRRSSVQDVSRSVVKTEVRLESPTHHMRLRSHSNTAPGTPQTPTRGRSGIGQGERDDTPTRRSVNRRSYMSATESSLAKVTKTTEKDDIGSNKSKSNIPTSPKRNLKKGRFSLGSSLESSSQFKSTPNLASHVEESDEDSDLDDLSIKSDVEAGTPTHTEAQTKSPETTPKKWSVSSSNIDSLRKSLNMESSENGPLLKPSLSERMESVIEKPIVVNKATAQKPVFDTNSRSHLKEDFDKQAMPPPAACKVARTKTSFLKKAANRRSMPELTLAQAKDILRGNHLLDKIANESKQANRDTELADKKRIGSGDSAYESNKENSLVINSLSSTLAPGSVMSTFVPTLDVTMVTPAQPLVSSSDKAGSLKDLDASPMDLPVKDCSPMKDSKEVSRHRSRDSLLRSNVSLSSVSGVAVSNVVTTSVAMATTVTMTTSVKTTSSHIESKKSVSHRDAKTVQAQRQSESGSQSSNKTESAAKTTGIKQRGGRKLPMPMLKTKSNSSDSEVSQGSTGSGSSGGHMTVKGMSPNRKRSESTSSLHDQIPPRSPKKISTLGSDQDNTTRLHNRKDQLRSAEDIRSELLDKQNKRLSTISSEIHNSTNATSERPTYKIVLKKTQITASSTSASSAKSTSPAKTSKLSPQASSSPSSTSSSSSPQTVKNSEKSPTVSSVSKAEQHSRNPTPTTSRVDSESRQMSSLAQSLHTAHSQSRTVTASGITDTAALINGISSAQSSHKSGSPSPDRSRLTLPLRSSASASSKIGMEACHSVVGDLKRTVQYAMTLYKQIHEISSDSSPQQTPQHDTSPQLKLLSDTFRDVVAMLMEFQEEQKTQRQVQTKDEATNTSEESSIDSSMLAVTESLLTQYSAKLSDEVLNLLKKKLDNY